MKTVIAKGKSPEEIQKIWAQQWNCSESDLNLEIIKKPGIFNDIWTVRVELKDQEAADGDRQEETRIVWDGTKYLIFPEEQVEKIVPFPMVGKLMYKGKELFEEIKISMGESLEYYPMINNGDFSWEIVVVDNGAKAIANVKHERPGRYFMNEDISWKKIWFLERHVTWKDSPWSIKPEIEQLFRDELAGRGIIFGIRPDCWEKMIAVEGAEEVLIAEQREPEQPINPKLEDFESKIVKEIDEKENVDYFASKLVLCEKDEIIARKIPGKESVPGKDIFGKELSVSKMEDFQLRAKSNAYLSEDGLEVKAQSPGVPHRLAGYNYSVEKVYIVNEDVDLDSGSIEFPGDVLIKRNVTDGLHVYSSGRVNIEGLVSGAKLKAEGGITIGSNVFNSNISVGERHYMRTEFLKELREMEERLTLFLSQINSIQKLEKSSDISYKKLFRAVLEKKYSDIPQKAVRLSKLVQRDDEDFLTREIIIAVHAIKYFVVDRGPYEINDNTYLLNALREIHDFLRDKGILVPESVVLVTGYVQNSEITCSGDFICRTDVYNSNIRVEGNIKIFGACRVSRLNGWKKIYIYELGSVDAGGDTSVKIPLSGHLTAEICHTNVKIFIGSNYVPIEQTVRKLDVYSEKGKIWVDKIKWNHDEIV